MVTIELIPNVCWHLEKLVQIIMGMNFCRYSSGGGGGFTDFLNALAAYLPIALFLAAIPPNLITVNGWVLQSSQPAVIVFCRYRYYVCTVL